MTTLPSYHHDAVRASILDALKTMPDIFLLRDSFERAIAAMRVTIDNALADVAHAWNECHMDPLRRLPPELHVSCLQWLQVHELFTASHVSRHWRAIALSEPTLWDSYDTAPFKNVEQSLNIVLYRARFVPFDITWGRRMELSPRLRELLVGSAARFRHVHFLPHSVDVGDLHLLDCAMPQLRTLDVGSVGHPMQFPDLMSDYTMPRLRSVKLGHAILPTRIQAVSSVTSLKLHVPPDCRHLFLLFPFAKSVTLRSVLSTTLLPPELPQSISSMIVFSDTKWQQDHSEQIQSSGWRIVPIMRFESTSVSRPLEWFAARTERSLSMVLSFLSTTQWVVEMTVIAADHARLHVFLMHENLGSDSSWDHQEHWTVNLTSLTVDNPTRLLPKLVGQIQALPSLQSLTLLMRTGMHTVARALGSWNKSISVPVLQELVLAYSVIPNAEDELRFMQTLPELFSWGHRRLEIVRLVGPGIAHLRQNDLSFVSTLCDSLRFEDGNIEESRNVLMSA